MSNKKIITTRGEVIGIGEFKIRKTKDFPYEIPRLSYIIINDSEDTFASTCIDLHIDGDGTTPEEATADMVENVYEFLCVNFSKNRGEGPAWEHLEDLFIIDDNSKNSWNAVSKFKLELAKKGRSTDITTELMGQITRLEEEINRLNELDLSNEEKITESSEIISRLKKEIVKLNDEKQKLQKITSQLILSHISKDYEFYNTYWTRRR